jgi:hypothetical protein
MNSIKNVVLYIKRAETFHTKEFIIDAFSSNNIGKVRDVRFIQKRGDYGKDYNGVVVIFERWNLNSGVKQLFNQMSDSPDGTTKFTYDYNNRRYWIINVYKPQIPENEEITAVDPSLPDKERIKELENLVKSMTVQMHYLQTRQEKTERQLMQAEHDDTQTRLYNMELRYLVEDSEMDKKWAEEDLQETIKHTESLRCLNARMSIDLGRKQNECDGLKQELLDEKCILNYIQEQAIEMRDMVKESLILDY